MRSSESKSMLLDKRYLSSISIYLSDHANSIQNFVVHNSRELPLLSMGTTIPRNLRGITIYRASEIHAFLVGRTNDLRGTDRNNS